MGPTNSFKNKNHFHKWLEKNCLNNKSIWIEFYKDGTEGISYNDALNESLAFGWIDSLIKKVDERVYVRMFSKRKANSKWSDVNKKKVAELIRNGEMTKYGLKAIEEAKKNGQWDKEDERKEIINVEELREVLKKRIKSIDEYDNLSGSLKQHYSLFYFSAKKLETKEKRLGMIVEYMKTKKRFM
jgi:uncharacterized protein YdeI (YjbR/CyaY-like superfamily)